ncbi:MAG: response regulator transcription factor, partial [Candidatus Methylomirabilales bacterium]
MEGEPWKILIVDDHEVVRMGLKTLLGRHEAFKVVGEAGSRAEAVEMAARYTPDVVIMDIRLPDGSGVEACRVIRAENPNAK